MGNRVHDPQRGPQTRYHLQDRCGTDECIQLGTATADTSFSSIFLTVKLNGAPLHTQTLDFKQSYQEGDTIDYNFENPLPSYIPSGTYTLQLQFLKNTNVKNGCLAFSFKIN